jgi:hypothetical protein
MHGEADIDQAKQICDTFNHLVHGDPIGSSFNLVDLGSRGLGYAVGKALSEPALCDFICFQSYCYLIVLMGRTAGCFPGVHSPKERRGTGNGGKGVYQQHAADGAPRRR